MLKIIEKIRLHLLLRRADKLIKITRNKDGTKVVDWEPGNKVFDAIPLFLGVMALLNIIGIIYLLVKI